MASVVKIVGYKTFIRNLHKSRERWARGIAKGLKVAGTFIQRKSQEIVPVDTGKLKGSARTVNAGGSGFFREDIVVFYKTDYAVLVHEDLDMRHKPGKKAKYLEEPSRKHRDDCIQIIQQAANKI